MRNPETCRSCNSQCEPGRGACKECLEHMLALGQEKREFRRVNNLCVKCGEALHHANRFLSCDVCRAKDRARRRKERQKGICNSCGASSAVGGCAHCKERRISTHQELKSVVVLAYSPNGSCQCCGETDLRFLQIDHINEDGNVHRKTVKASSLYSWLKEHNFPNGFQVLCASCNLGKSLNNGVCPHLDEDYPHVADVDPVRFDVITSALPKEEKSRLLRALSCGTSLKQHKKRPPRRCLYQPKVCPHCSGNNTIKHGIQRTRPPHVWQIWYCKTCKVRFSEELNTENVLPKAPLTLVMANTEAPKNKAGKPKTVPTLCPFCNEAWTTVRDGKESTSTGEVSQRYKCKNCKKHWQLPLT